MTGAHQAPRPTSETWLRTAAVAVAVMAIAAIAALLLRSGNGDSHSANGGHPSTAPPSAVRQSASTTQSSAASVSVEAKPKAKAATVGNSPAAKVTPLTYVVRRGDNLTVIAAWFHLHGYGALYENNKAVLGDDPDLIHPGQRITISSRGMTTNG